VNKRRTRARWHDVWNVCRTSVMNSAINSVMGSRRRIVCGIGNDCNISTSLACGGDLAAINDFSTIHSDNAEHVVDSNEDEADKFVDVTTTKAQALQLAGDLHEFALAKPQFSQVRDSPESDESGILKGRPWQQMRMIQL
jgi:hypothetical protein